MGRIVWFLFFYGSTIIVLTALGVVFAATGHWILAVICGSIVACTYIWGQVLVHKEKNQRLKRMERSMNGEE